MFKEPSKDSNLSRRKNSFFWEWITEIWGDSDKLVKKQKELPVDDEKVYDRFFNKMVESIRALKKLRLNDKAVNVRDLVEIELRK